jgi:predicted acylesterase/phospholipase RssA
MDPNRPAIAVSCGGGGAFAFGFCLGVADGLRDQGIDISVGPLIGTSGGSHAAVAIAARLEFDDVAPIWRDYVETVGRIWVKAAPLTEGLYGSLDVTNVGAVAVRMLTFRRRILWAGEHRPADIVAASSSPFPFVRPHKIEGKRYIDGGHRSAFSADLAPAADVQLVLAPLSDRRQGLLGKIGARQVVKESRKWNAATGGEAIVVGPTDAMCSIGRQVYELAIPLGRDLAERLQT